MGCISNFPNTSVAKNSKFKLCCHRNFLTSLSLLRYQKEKEICGTGTVRANRTEDVPSKFTVDVEKAREEHMIL